MKPSSPLKILSIASFEICTIPNYKYLFCVFCVYAKLNECCKKEEELDSFQYNKITTKRDLVILAWFCHTSSIGNFLTSVHIRKIYILILLSNIWYHSQKVGKISKKGNFTQKEVLFVLCHFLVLIIIVLAL